MIQRISLDKLVENHSKLVCLNSDKIIKIYTRAGEAGYFLWGDQGHEKISDVLYDTDKGMMSFLTLEGNEISIKPGYITAVNVAKLTI